MKFENHFYLGPVLKPAPHGWSSTFTLMVIYILIGSDSSDTEVSQMSSVPAGKSGPLSPKQTLDQLGTSSLCNCSDVRSNKSSYSLKHTKHIKMSFSVGINYLGLVKGMVHPKHIFYPLHTRWVFFCFSHSKANHFWVAGQQQTHLSLLPETPLVTNSIEINDKDKNICVN